MYKYYVRLNLSYVNVKFKQNDFIFGIPGPLTTISFMKALSLKIDSKLCDNKVLISFLNSVENSSNTAYNQKSFNHTKEITTIFSNPTGFINFILISSFISSETKENFKKKIISNLLKLRYNGGIIDYDSIESLENNIQVEDSIDKIKKPYGFIALSSKDKINKLEDIIISEKINGLKKEIVNVAVLGINKNIKTNNELSYYNKEHYFGESIIGKIKYASFKKLNVDIMDSDFINNNSWFVSENESCIFVETLNKI